MLDANYDGGKKYQDYVLQNYWFIKRPLVFPDVLEIDTSDHDQEVDCVPDKQGVGVLECVEIVHMDYN